MRSRFQFRYRARRLPGRRRSLSLEAVERRILLANDTIPPNLDQIDLFADDPAPHVQTDSDNGIYGLDSQPLEREPLIWFQGFQAFDSIDRLAISEYLHDAVLDIRGDRVVIIRIDSSSESEPFSNTPQSTSPASTIDIDVDQTYETIDIQSDAFAGSAVIPVASTTAPTWIAEPLSQLVDRTFDLDAFTELDTLVSFDTTISGFAYTDITAAKDTYSTEQFVLYARTDIPRIPLAEPEAVAATPPPTSNPETGTSFTPEPIDIASLPTHGGIQSTIHPPTSIAGTSVASVGDAPLSVEVVMAEAPVYNDNGYSLESQEMGPFVRSVIDGTKTTQVASIQTPLLPPTSTIIPAELRLPKSPEARDQASQSARPQRDRAHTNDTVEVQSNRTTPVKDKSLIRANQLVHAVESNELPCLQAGRRENTVTRVSQPHVVSQSKSSLSEMASSNGIPSIDAPSHEAIKEVLPEIPPRPNRILASISQSVRLGTPLVLLAIPLFFCRRYWHLPETQLGPQEILANRTKRNRICRRHPMRILQLRRLLYRV